MNSVPANRRVFQALVEVVEALRGATGCPWDKEQTHQTLTRFAIEEAHELGEAIDHDDVPHMIEELGDLLLQVVLHAEIGKQEGRFTLDDVIEGICDKMIRRHPHVFGNTALKTSSAVLENWAKLKDKEKPARTDGFGLPPNMPALITSQKIGEKTRKQNFDFDDLNHAFSKVEEEVEEFKKAASSGDREAMEHELGDILFAAAQVSRFITGGDAEQSLRKSNQRFEKRYFTMLNSSDENFAQLPQAEKERLWQAAKKSLKL